MTDLEQLKSGAYTTSELKGIEIKPAQISYVNWNMADTLGHAEFEDIGARLIGASVNEGQWVGLTYGDLGKQLMGEMEKIHKQNASEPKNLKDRVYDCITSVFKGKPTHNYSKVVETENIQENIEPMSVLAMRLYATGNAQTLTNELQDMKDAGYLNIVKVNDVDVLLPTTKLIETVYQRQSL